MEFVETYAIGYRDFFLIGHNKYKLMMLYLPGRKLYLVFHKGQFSDLCYLYYLSMTSVKISILSSYYTLMI
ncbi:unnamed protein product [Caenorhabditis nigoni]